MTDGGFAPEHVNVADQRRDPDSLLNFVQLLIRRYRECPELGWATRPEILDQPHRGGPRAPQHLGRRVDRSRLHNLGADAVVVPLRLADCDDTASWSTCSRTAVHDRRRGPHGRRPDRLRLPLAARQRTWLSTPHLASQGKVPASRRSSPPSTSDGFASP